MNVAELAQKLALADVKTQKKLLKSEQIFLNYSLAIELKKLCYEAWLTNPQQTKRIISALVIIAETLNSPNSHALAKWSLGIGEIISGQMRTAIEFFDKSEELFLSENQVIEAAETQIGKIYALAMLGLYDEAIECGLRVRDIFIENKQLFSAGKIEHNLGNIYRRRNRYDQAEHFLRMAKQRLNPQTDYIKLIQINNSLANALAHQHKFKSAEEIYSEALEQAKKENLEVTQAEIESNLGHLLLFQGKFDKSLQFFESSRRKYEKMQMPHQSAIAEQEMADLYLELNLFPESSEIYENVTKVFQSLELNNELARTFSNLARCYIAFGKTQKAHNLLTNAQKLYNDEKNLIGEATVKLIEAQLFLQEKNYEMALEKAISAEPIFAQVNFLSRSLQSRWLRGESLRFLGELFVSRQYLESTLNEAKTHFIPQITLLCLTSLGLLEVSGKNYNKAEKLFKEAVQIIEEMRTPLPAEDFRTAFFTDKLTAYYELISLYLKKNSEKYLKNAFQIAENARSRVLLEVINHNLQDSEKANRYNDLQNFPHIEKLREELNWLYNQLNYSTLTENVNLESISKIQAEIKVRESDFLELNRKQKIFANSNNFGQTDTINIEKLQTILGEKSTLIEFLSLNGKFLAFVITNKKVNVIENLANEAEIIQIIQSLRFQIDSMKNPFAGKSNFQTQMLSRTQHYLHLLYQKLLQPIKKLIKNKRLIIVPHKELYYVPFHALFDGEKYVIENQEVLYTPSARIFKHCFEKRKSTFNSAVLVGADDQFAPKIKEEIESLSNIFPNSKILLGKNANLANLKQYSNFGDVLHLSCHGKFRPDNPLFSSLKLNEDWLNVSDISKLNLNSGLVVLSACETGVNTITAGDEILGLTRGFLSAGANSLIISSWQIDDETTFKFMQNFYQKIRLGISLSESLRLTQTKIMKEYPHPFYWSPFILFGTF